MFKTTLAIIGMSVFCVAAYADLDNDQLPAVAQQQNNMQKGNANQNNMQKGNANQNNKQKGNNNMPMGDGEMQQNNNQEKGEQNCCVPRNGCDKCEKPKPCPKPCPPKCEPKPCCPKQECPKPAPKPCPPKPCCN